MSNRYDSKEWKELVEIQNTMENVDILTITGFMDDDQFIAHVDLYKEKANE